MDHKKPEKTFKEKIENLKRSSLAQHMEPKFLDFLPEDFYLLDKRRMMYMWHFLSDKKIGELYGVTEYEVRKRRRDFDINPITSTFDRIARETYGREDWVEEELKTILPFEYNDRKIPHTNSTPFNNEKELSYMKATGIVRRIDD